MAVYTRTEAREWARETLIGAVNCTIPSFTSDLRGVNEQAIRHDVRLASEHGFVGTLGVCEVSISLPEYLQFLRIVRDEAGKDFVVVHHGSWSRISTPYVVPKAPVPTWCCCLTRPISTPNPSRRSTTTPRPCAT